MCIRDRGMTVPKATSNERDWRLFQELAVQADIIISSGRYLRDYAEGQTQEILSVYDLSLIQISEPPRPYSISYAVFCLKKKTKHNKNRVIS